MVVWKEMMMVEPRVRLVRMMGSKKAVWRAGLKDE